MSSIFAASRVHLIKVLNRSHPPPCTRAAVASLTPAATQSAQMTGLLKSNPRIILGSSSRTRRLLMDELAAEHGFTYEVLTADIDEKSIRLPDPRELVLRLAHAKADAIAAKLAGTQQPGQAPAGLLVTCDQVVVHEGRILEKPEDAGEAREFIAGYGRSPASTVGSVVCTDLASGRRVEGVDSTQIHFDPIPQASVEALIAEGEVFWCAGGLMVEHDLVQPHVAKVVGGIDSVMGLPKQLVVQLLCELDSQAQS